MEVNLPSNKNQELNIRQSFLHFNNSKACVKTLFWKYMTALLTSNYKKKNLKKNAVLYIYIYICIYLLKKNNTFSL